MKYDKENLKQALQQTVGTVVFTKNDGTERTLRCTLQESFLPVSDKKESTTVKKENPDVLSVWDVEAQGWRSFRIDSILSTEI